MARTFFASAGWAGRILNRFPLTRCRAGRLGPALLVAVLLPFGAGTAAADCWPDPSAIADRAIEGSRGQHGRGGDLRAGFRLHIPAALPAAAGADRRCRINVDLGYRWRSGHLSASGGQAYPASGAPLSGPDTAARFAIGAAVDLLQGDPASWAIEARYAGSIDGGDATDRTARMVSRLTLIDDRAEVVSTLGWLLSAGTTHWQQDHQIGLTIAATDTASLRTDLGFGRAWRHGPVESEQRSTRRVAVTADLGENGISLDDLLWTLPVPAWLRGGPAFGETPDGFPWILLPSLTEVSAGWERRSDSDRKTLGVTLVWPDKHVESDMRLLWGHERLDAVHVGLTAGSRLGTWLRVSLTATRARGFLGGDSGLLIETGWTH